MAISLESAVEELYSHDPDEFMDRRAALVRQARQEDRDLAKQIGGLRKPSRSAWTLNQLARSKPDLIEGLRDIAEQLQAAQGSLDGDRIRELTGQRRSLVDGIVRAALTDASASATLREEVTGTVEAAIADPAVAEALGSGTLVRAAQWSGFGMSAPPDLAIVPPPKPAKQPTPRPAKAADRTAHQADRDVATRDAAEQERHALEQERRAAQEERRAAEKERRTRQGAARSTLRQAERAVEQAQKRYEETEQSVRQLQEQLADARRKLGDRGVELRQAQQDRRTARKVLDELGH